MIIAFIKKYFTYFKYGIIIIILGLSHYFTFDYGQKIIERKLDKMEIGYKLEIIELKNKQLQEIQELNDKYDKASLDYQTDLAKLKDTTKIVTRVVTKEIEKPIYKECRITDDGFKYHSDLVDKLNEN